MLNVATLLGTSLFLSVVKAHLAPWAPGMYCSLGNTGSPDLNSYAIVSPLYQLPFDQWWMHHSNNCDQFPPPAGEFLELPAGGSFHVDIGSNRAKTSMSYNGRDTSDWPDGGHYPEDYHVDSCIISPNMHTQNQANAAGTAFAISYVSDIKAVTPENLAVFSVAYNTPWKRIATYQVPAALPACPPGGCICAWGWIPNGCGQPNMYMVPFSCRVTGAKSTTPVAPAKPAVWCENNPSACTKGAKQMLFWNQASGNNIQVDGTDASGGAKSPAYNSKCGFPNGAQNDIFAGAPSGGGGYTPPNPVNTPAGPGKPPVTATNTASAPATTVTAPLATAPNATIPDTGKKNTAPSCKKRRRSVNGEVSLVKRSSLVEGISAHRRHARHLL